MKPLSVSFLLIAMTSAVIAYQQRDETAPPRLSIRSDLVTLQVAVVDTDGRFVSDLRREHFSIYDEGEARPIAFFTSDDLPATIGLVVDSSASMRGRRDDVTAATAAFAAMSDPFDEFFTVNFNETVRLGLPRNVTFTKDWNQLRAALAAAPAQGMTALHDGIDRALDHINLGTRDRRALIVVSDGGDNASAHTAEAVVQHARAARTVIYTVTLVDRDAHEANPKVLKTLARETGGRAFSPRSADEVIAAFEQIAREIRSGYTIGFDPAEAGHSGFHSVRVVVDAGNRRHLTARTRAGYYAGPSTTPAR